MASFSLARLQSGSRRMSVCRTVNVANGPDLVCLNVAFVLVNRTISADPELFECQYYDLQVNLCLTSWDTVVRNLSSWEITITPPLKFCSAAIKASIPWTALLVRIGDE